MIWSRVSQERKAHQDTIFFQADAPGMKSAGALRVLRMGIGAAVMAAAWCTHGPSAAGYGSEYDYRF
jgi:hypothetical protein